MTVAPMSPSGHERAFSVALDRVCNAPMNRHSALSVGNGASNGPSGAAKRRSELCHKPTSRVEQMPPLGVEPKFAFGLPAGTFMPFNGASIAGQPTVSIPLATLWSALGSNISDVPQTM